MQKNTIESDDRFATSWEDSYYEGIAFNDENFPYDDEEGIECMNPGCFEECMYDIPSKHCQIWKECEAGEL